MRGRKKYLWTIAALLLGISGFSVTAQGAGEKVFFGSEKYEWKLGEESPIGVYAGGGDGVNEVEITLQYDPEILEYVSGGSLTEAGTVKLDASGIAVQEYGEMLSFLPKKSGTTEIVLSHGKITNASGTAEFTEGVSAPVSIPLAAGCELTELLINGESVPGFQPSVTEYSVEIEQDVTEAEISAAPADSQTKLEISGTDLSGGENEIRIVTTNGAGEQGLYRIQVKKKETVAESAVSKEENGSSPEEKPKEETLKEETEPEKNPPDQILKILLAGSVVLLLLLLAALAAVKRQKRKKKTKSKPRASEREETSFTSWEPDLTLAREELPVTEEGETEIQVKHVTMEFTKEKDESSSIKELWIRTLKGQRKIEKFKALDDVSFTIKKGEVVGIIGTNGSGKSTILKIISGVLTPTQGEVIADRSKIQLLTLGTGFDFELTGRENVYLNGAVIGYTKEFIDKKYQDIVKFAELEGFMEQKVKNYSSGMVSRLGFAIATARETPEILILDEVLSVGDMFFRKKSEKRIKEMMRSGSTVLIVSHSPSVIKANCTKAIWIEKGKLRAVGRPGDVCRAYEKKNG